MPYFDHQMATSISDSPSDSQSGSKSSKKDKVLRTVAISNKKTEKMTSKDPDASITSKYKTNIDLRKLMFMRNLLKAEIENLNKTKGALPIDNNPNYEKFTYDKAKVVSKDDDSQYFEAQNSEYPGQPLGCTVYDSKAGIDPNSLYLRILRHLGKKHQSILATWDLFVNGDNNIEIFQEACSVGNLEQFVQKETLNEKQISLYAFQLLKGMDFLGDIGIAHRDIQPINILLRPAQKDNFIKITNFRKAIIYWDVSENDVIYTPCEPKENQNNKNYQAPEIYGDPSKEEFDPIKADTWSFGAVVFFMISKEYPYNVGSKSDDLEKEIADNVDKLTVAASGKELLKAILKANAEERMPIGFIEKSAWLAEAKKTKMKMIVDKNAPAGGAKGKGADFGKSNIFGRVSGFNSTASSKKSMSSKSKSMSSKSKSKSGASSKSSSKSGASSKSSSKSGAESGEESGSDSESGESDSTSGSSSKSGASSKSSSKSGASSKSSSKSGASSKSSSKSGAESGEESGSDSESGEDDSASGSSSKSGASSKSSSKSGASSKSSSKSGASSKSSSKSGAESGEESGSDSESGESDSASGSSSKSGASSKSSSKSGASSKSSSKSGASSKSKSGAESGEESEDGSESSECNSASGSSSKSGASSKSSSKSGASSKSKSKSGASSKSGAESGEESGSDSEAGESDSASGSSSKSGASSKSSSKSGASSKSKSKSGASSKSGSTSGEDSGAESGSESASGASSKSSAKSTSKSAASSKSKSKSSASSKSVSKKSKKK